MTDTEKPEQTKVDRRWRLLILGASLLIFLVSTVYGLLHGFNVTQPAWSGYYTLLVDATLPEGQLDQILAAGGFDGFISAGTNQVLLASANGVRAESWQALRSRLGVPDPRFDGYLTGLEQFFSDRDHQWQIAYLPVRDGLLSVMFRLGRAFGSAGVSWQILEWRPIQGGVLALAAFLVGALVVWASRGRRLLVGLSLLPWVPLCMSAGPVFFAFQVASLLLWSLVLESLLPSLKRYSHDVPRAPFFWDKPSDTAWVLDSLRRIGPFLDRGSLTVRGALWILVQFAYMACVWFQGTRELIPGILVVNAMAWPALLLLLARMYQLRHRRSEHQLFAPVPMLTSRRVLVTSLRPALLPVLGLSILLPSFFALFLGSGTAAAIPVPGGAINWSLSYRNAQIFLEKPAANAVDDLANLGGAALVRHLAFQASLPFRKNLDWREYSLPPAGTEIGVEDFALGDSGVSGSLDVHMRLDDAWLHGLLGKLPVRSIDRLIADQGRISGLVFASQGKVYSTDVWIIPAVTGLTILVLPFLLAGRKPGFRQLYGSGRISMLGRKVAA